MVVGVGRATRLLRFLSDLPKTYEGTARLGVETDTLDADGAVVRRSDVRVDRTALDRAVAVRVGESLQSPPAYSAVKVDGTACCRISVSVEAPRLSLGRVEIKEDKSNTEERAQDRLKQAEAKPEQIKTG